MTYKLIPVKGSVPVNRHKFLGPADPSEHMEVTVKLRRKTQQGLPTLDEFVAGKRERGHDPARTRRKLRRTARRCRPGSALGESGRFVHLAH